MCVTGMGHAVCTVHECPNNVVGRQLSIAGAMVNLLSEKYTVTFNLESLSARDDVRDNEDQTLVLQYLGFCRVIELPRSSERQSLWRRVVSPHMLVTGPSGSR